MNELRWILLAAGIVLIAVLYFQGRRKRPNAAAPVVREVVPSLGDALVTQSRRIEPTISHAPAPLDELPQVHVRAPHIESTPERADLRAERNAPSTIEPFTTEPLTTEHALSTAALDRLTITQPLKPTPQPVSESMTPAAPSTRAQEFASSPAVASGDAARASPRAAVSATRPSRKIVAIRVPALGQRFDGARLREVFIEQGLRHGRYNIFHRNDHNGVTLFSAASMVEPGTFDLATMSQTDYPGVSLFLQLPGPSDGRAAFDAMLVCAQALQREFGGALQGERGKSLTPETIARMREEIADFEHLISRAGSLAVRQ